MFVCLSERTFAFFDVRVCFASLQGCTRLYTVVHSCTRLYTVVHGCTRLYTVVHGCTVVQLYTVVQGCTRLYTVVQLYNCTRLYTVVQIVQKSGGVYNDVRDYTSVYVLVWMGLCFFFIAHLTDL